MRIDKKIIQLLEFEVADSEDWMGEAICEACFKMVLNLGEVGELREHFLVYFFFHR